MATASKVTIYLDPDSRFQVLMIDREGDTIDTDILVPLAEAQDKPGVYAPDFSQRQFRLYINGRELSPADFKLIARDAGGTYKTSIQLLNSQTFQKDDYVVVFNGTRVNQEDIQFTEGQRISASKLNAAFSALLERIEELKAAGLGFTNSTLYRIIAEGAKNYLLQTAFEHRHPINDVDNLQETLDSKSDVGHTHVKNDITDFAHTHVKSDITDFDHTHVKSDITDFAHTHVRNDITDFAHTHDISDVNNLQSTLDNKSDITHTHAIDDLSDVNIANPSSGEVVKYNGTSWVNGNIDWSELVNVPSTFPSASHNHDDRYYTESEIDTALAGKSDVGHTHVKADITDFSHTHKKADITDFAHNHEISDINNLQTELDRKAALVHQHTKSDITDFAHQHSLSEISNLPSLFTNAFAITQYTTSSTLPSTGGIFVATHGGITLTLPVPSSAGVIAIIIADLGGPGSITVRHNRHSANIMHTLNDGEARIFIAAPSGYWMYVV
jgi:hypothetical protein